MGKAFKCPKGHRLEVADPSAGGKAYCAGCQRYYQVPGVVQQAAYDLAAAPPAAATADDEPPRVVRHGRAHPAEASDEPDPVQERRRARGRHAKLSTVGAGLACHYASTLAALLGVALFWIALGFHFVPVLGAEFAVVSGLALMVSCVAFLAASVLEIPN